MQIPEATKLISKGVSKKRGSLWADFGAGEGTFTRALSELLGDSSKIAAVDRNSRALQKIPSRIGSVMVERINEDIVDFVPNQPLDGIIMGNVLHYILMKMELIERIFKEVLKSNGELIVIEYDTDMSNPWVPFPITCEQLTESLTSRGFICDQVGRTPSAYHAGGMYSLRVTNSTNR